MSSEVNQGSKCSGILSDIFSSRSVAQILDFFLDHKEFDYSPAEIAEKSGLSFRTVFREIPSLERNQLIYHSRKIGKTNMYRLNPDFYATILLEKFVLEMVQIRNTQKEDKPALSIEQATEYIQHD
jgi:hypothetical protein